MILCIADLLEAAELDAMGALIERAQFEDGKKTAGWHARLVKDNQQMTGAELGEAQAIIVAALDRNSLVRSAMLPAAIKPPLIARYHGGMTYGSHVDDAVMGDPPMRSDISCTIFLSDPQDYDGGELVIDDSAGEQVYKLARGSAIFYSSGSLHHVAPVTRGQRMVAVTWMQSIIRHAGRREILFDLDQSRRALFEKDGKTAIFDLLSKSYANLMRMWAEL